MYRETLELISIVSLFSLSDMEIIVNTNVGPSTNKKSSFYHYQLKKRAFGRLRIRQNDVFIMSYDTR